MPGQLAHGRRGAVAVTITGSGPGGVPVRARAPGLLLVPFGPVVRVGAFLKAAGPSAHTGLSNDSQVY